MQKNHQIAPPGSASGCYGLVLRDVPFTARGTSLTSRSALTSPHLTLTYTLFTNKELSQAAISWLGTAPSARKQGSFRCEACKNCIYCGMTRTIPRSRCLLRSMKSSSMFTSGRSGSWARIRMILPIRPSVSTTSFPSINCISLLIKTLHI